MTRYRAAIVTAAILPLAAAGVARAVPLDSFAIIAATTVTNASTSTITGNIALYPGTAVTGFPVPGNDIGTIYAGSTNATAQQAQSDLTDRYNTESSNLVTQSLTGQNLGNRTLVAGVYGYDISAGLTGDLTLDGQGNPNSVFIFKIGSTLDTASSSRILLTNGANGANVYFLVGSSATLGTGSTFNGRIIAADSITLTTNVTIECGAVWARTAQVTLDGDTIDTTCPVTGPTDVGDVVDTTATENAAAVAAALDSSGPLPPAFEALIDFLSPAELADALAQLAGEAGTGAATAGSQSADSFLSSVFDSNAGDTAPNAAPAENGPSPATVKALGYASEHRPGPAEVAAISLAAPMPDTGRWSVWASATDGQSTIDGDAVAGTHDLSSSAFNLSAGFGRQVTPNTRVGFAFGGGTNNFALADGFGSGSSQMIQAAAYGHTDFGAAYVTTAVAYAFDNVSTARNVIIGAPLNVNDRYTANYNASDVTGGIEAGYRLGPIVPYAALRGGAFFTPAYSEVGTGPYGLNYQASTDLSLRSELGARIAHTFALRDGASWSLKAGVAWAHDFGQSSSTTAGFQGIPGWAFAVNGAKADSDWLLISAGSEYAFGNGFAVGANFNGAFTSNAETMSGTGRISYRW